MFHHGYLLDRISKTIYLLHDHQIVKKSNLYSKIKHLQRIFAIDLTISRACTKQERVNNLQRCIWSPNYLCLPFNQGPLLSLCYMRLRIRLEFNLAVSYNTATVALISPALIFWVMDLMRYSDVIISTVSTSAVSAILSIRTNSRERFRLCLIEQFGLAARGKTWSKTTISISSPLYLGDDAKFEMISWLHKLHIKIMLM
uniref:Uncharacterized protein n=1 Tax=Strigamia maritima TaxID=126957 RepID=T1IJA0_STRMM